MVAEQLMPAFREFEIGHDDLAELLGEQRSGVLWGRGFEDFLGQHYSASAMMTAILSIFT